MIAADLTAWTRLLGSFGAAAVPWARRSNGGGVEMEAPVNELGDREEGRGGLENLA